MMKAAMQDALCKQRGFTMNYATFGAVDTCDLLNPLEQEIFDFYARNVGRYKNVLDIGANVGIHSILMAKQGWKVTAFEPDPTHYRMLLDNIEMNGLDIATFCAAVSDHDGVERLVRVLGNTTGNHLEGDKEPYGDLDYMVVPVFDCRPLLKNADFAKIDCEGHEATILTACDPLELPDCMVEVGNSVNASRIFNHLCGKRKMFAKVNNWRWQEILVISEMPKHHSEGMLFIGDAL